MAAVHLLLESGVRVVLPPPFLCCGFPHRANAKDEAHGKIVLQDVIVFSQIRGMLRHLTFDAVVVTCGTCREALEKMEVEKVFGCDVADAVAFVGGRGLSLPAEGEALYHTPCHDSFDGKGPEVIARTLGIAAGEVPHCCSEAGTLALSRPDIAEAMRHRKREALSEARRERETRTVLLTNCPSCLTGLRRNADLGTDARHVAVEAARRLSGERWPHSFAAAAESATRVRF